MWIHGMMMQNGDSSDQHYLPISDYGMIGDCRSAALVSKTGSIDWCCWPNFDSPWLFGRLLDHRTGGHFTLQPVGSFLSKRRYIDRTNVLETTVETPSGRARLIDLMPVTREKDKLIRLRPFREILRKVEGIEGSVEFELVFSPRPSYGQSMPRLETRSPNDILCQTGDHLLHLRSELQMAAEGSDVRRRFAVHAGTHYHFALAFTEGGPGVYPMLGEEADREIASTVEYWHRWADQFNYSGPHPGAVLRSALALKLMAFAPSGAVIAAPTSSLPEAMGGTRNWDYRFCWLRDASFTIEALDSLGFGAEGHAFMQWMLHATRLTHPALQVLYTVYGDAHIPERELDHMEGYRGSRPVRVGNGAFSQFQIDLYGELFRAVDKHYRDEDTLDGDTRRLLVGAANLVTQRWNEPDHGIWEERSDKTHHVHGKFMAWTALDCAIRIARKFGIRADVERWEQARMAIERAVLTHGFNPQLGSFVRSFGSSDLDASLLMMPLVGFIPGDDPRMRSTIDAVQRKLAVGELVYRHREVDDGLAGQEGAFLACSFWLVSSLALAGRLKEAHEAFSRMLGRSNELGLLPEEIEPATGEFLGNFPQGLTHIALINAALTLQAVEQGGETSRAGGTISVEGA